MSHLLIGLDIGGANLKLHTSSGEVKSQVFPLWKYPSQLVEGLKNLVGDLSSSAIGVTMTGELCDCFRTKREGVKHIVQSVEEIWPLKAYYWSTDSVFVSASEAMEYPLKVAASNWHGLATFLAQKFTTGRWLLMDIGSTTTDLIPIIDGKVCAKGKTDPERLKSGELVYTGVRRTPIFGLLTHTAAEWFASTQDAYVVLGEIDEDPQDRDTADNRPLTIEHSTERLLRCYLHDTETSTKNRAMSIAEEIRDAQENIILKSVKRNLSDSISQWKVITSGSGEFLARSVCEKLGIENYSLAELFGAKVSQVAPAFAMTKLLQATIN